MNWPLYIGIAIVVAAVKYPKLRMLAAVALAGYLTFSHFWKPRKPGTPTPQ